MGDYSQENLKTITEFFEQSKEAAWGKLIAVSCTPRDLIQWREDNIPASIREVITQSGWQDQNSFDWAGKGSGNPIFYLFKVYEVWRSIAEVGVKTPLHIHSTANDNGMRFHPSNNKIEIVCEYFPDLPVTVLYHDYDYLRKFWPEPILDWYKQFPHCEIKKAEQYLALYGLNQDNNEMEFGWDFCERIISIPDVVWSKLKPRAWDWQHINIDTHSVEPSLLNALFLTATDRFHRMAMDRDKIRLGDILIVDENTVEFCGKVYEL